MIQNVNSQFNNTKQPFIVPTQTAWIPMPISSNHNPELPLPRTNNHEIKANSNSKYMWGGLIALGVGIAGLLVYLRKGKPVIRPTLPENITNTEWAEKITAFVKEHVSSKENTLFNQILRYSGSKKYDCINYIANGKQGILPLEQFFALQEAHIPNSFKLPDVITLENLSPQKAIEVCKILATKFEANFITRKYSKDTANIFLDMLQNITNPEPKKHVFMYIENFAEFLNDISKSESLSDSFKKLLDKNKTSKITYLTETPQNTTHCATERFNLKFKPEISSANFEGDLETYMRKQQCEITVKTTELSKKTSDYIVGGNSIDPILSSIINTEQSQNSLIFKNGVTFSINKFMTAVNDTIPTHFETLSCKTSSIQELHKQIEQSIQKNKELYDLTGKKTFLYLEDFEDLVSTMDNNLPEYKKIKDTFDTCGQKHNTTLVFATKENALPEIIASNKQNSILTVADLGKNQENYKKILAKIKANMAALDVHPQISTRLFRSFFADVALEKAGMPLPAPVTNGILVYGNDNATTAAIDSIRKILDGTVQFHKIKFDTQEPIKSLHKIMQGAEQAKNSYETTKMRTIIEVENIEEFLSNDTTAAARRDLGVFKSFIELISKKYHTTILARAKSIDNLESASIGTERFGILLKVS